MSWRDLFKAPETGPPQIVLDVKPSQMTDHTQYLKALEEMRVHSPEQYQYVVDYYKGELERARRVTLFSAQHSRDFIANAAISRDSKCRALSMVVDDMVRTVDKIKKEKEPEPDLAGENYG